MNKLNPNLGHEFIVNALFLLCQVFCLQEL